MFFLCDSGMMSNPKVKQQGSVKEQGGWKKEKEGEEGGRERRGGGGGSGPFWSVEKQWRTEEIGADSSTLSPKPSGLIEQ